MKQMTEEEREEIEIRMDDKDYIKEEVIREEKSSQSWAKREEYKGFLVKKAFSIKMLRSMPKLILIVFLFGLFNFDGSWSISHYKAYRTSTGLALIHQAEQSAPSPMTDEQKMTLVHKIENRSTIGTYITFIKQLFKE